MKGKIIIKDKVYFEPNGLEKPSKNREILGVITGHYQESKRIRSLKTID